MLVRIAELSEVRNLLLKDRWPRKRSIDAELLSYVEGIVRDVRERGDKALLELTEKFDGVRLDASRLRVSRGEIEEAYNMVSEKQISAIKAAKKRIFELERNLLNRLDFVYADELGVRIRFKPQPIESVGCYVPGGRLPYPSTLLMTVVPAKAAGVPRTVVCTPPQRDGSIHPLVLVAADICGVDEIYRVGGAQAIAAMAYGTESIKPVAKIAGPGNRYVMAAKMIVSRDIPIDHPAGPSEIMIIADETADPYHVALDILSQLEHGPGSIAVLVTTSGELVRQVHEIMGPLLGTAELAGEAWMLVAESMDEAASFANDFAPEHLEIIAEGAERLADKVSSAGLILLGSSTPVSLSDYCLGTNHVIPTGGYSHVYRPLSALDFIKLVYVAECPPKALRILSEYAVTLAESEGFERHAMALKGRLKVG